MNIELIKYIIQNMCSKEHIYSIYNHYHIEYRKSDSYNILIKRFIDSNIEIELDFITRYFRDNWVGSPIEKHLENLTSGLLQGHSWHGAMPSMLHLSLQNKVRNHINGDINLEELIRIGADIMKHEYFMVCVHDMCESYLINSFNDCIPPIRKKSISDFVFKGIPYDLKISNNIEGYGKDYINQNKEEIINKLLEGADIQRLRNQAKNTFNNWGSNRFYLLVQNQDRWLDDPKDVLKEFIEQVHQLEEPIQIEIESNYVILCQIIAI